MKRKESPTHSPTQGPFSLSCGLTLPPPPPPRAQSLLRWLVARKGQCIRRGTVKGHHRSHGSRDGWLCMFYTSLRTNFKHLTFHKFQIACDTHVKTVMGLLFYFFKRVSISPIWPLSVTSAADFMEQRDGEHRQWDKHRCCGQRLRVPTWLPSRREGQTVGNLRTSDLPSDQ